MIFFLGLILIYGEFSWTFLLTFFQKLMLVARVDEGNKGVGLQVWKYIRKHRDSN